MFDLDIRRGVLFARAHKFFFFFFSEKKNRLTISLEGKSPIFSHRNRIRNGLPPGWWAARTRNRSLFQSFQPEACEDVVFQRCSSCLKEAVKEKGKGGGDSLLFFLNMRFANRKPPVDWSKLLLLSLLTWMVSRSFHEAEGNPFAEGLKDTGRKAR